MARSATPTAALVALTALSIAGCANTGAAGPGAASLHQRAFNRPYQVRGRWYTPGDQPGYDAVGIASWYSYPGHSRTTADGEPFDATLSTAAHTTLPIPSYLDVTDLENGRRIRVRLNDRGPFVAGRIVDLSRSAADALGFTAKGTARVRVRYVGPAPSFVGDRDMAARAPQVAVD